MKKRPPPAPPVARESYEAGIERDISMLRELAQIGVNIARSLERRARLPTEDSRDLRRQIAVIEREVRLTQAMADRFERRRRARARLRALADQRPGPAGGPRTVH